MARRVCVIGLDCATPQLVFDRFEKDLPNLGRLRSAGLWGELESCIPPITVPAWMSMMTSKNPGRLGFYGFRNRSDHSYDKLAFATSRHVKEDTVWDILSRRGKKVILLGVPQTYPPKAVNGILVSCFLAPNTSVDYTYPSELKEEIQQVVGDYVLDVHDFRTEDKQRILDTIYDMTAKRFRLARHFLTGREWDFFMMVEMGVDRIHHGFWKYGDPNHPKHVPGNPFEHSIRDYYRYVDGEVGKILKLLDGDTAVLVVSDHGARPMLGGICVNEWLMREGLLALRTRPAGPEPFDPSRVDWGRTLAWGEGGYYSRLFLNVKGRE
ncbi:MAG: alkaline phosphatase family protein, partial [Vicinamibacteria bacterium]